MNFHPKLPIRYVQGDDSDGSVSFVRTVYFMNKNKQDVCFYNPRNRAKTGVVHEIKENEELIGVYGVQKEKASFSAFGLIVKVNHD